MTLFVANFQKFTFLTLFVAFVFNILNVQVRFSAQFKQASIQNFLFLNKLSGCLIGHLQYMNYLLLNEFYKYLIVVFARIVYRKKILKWVLLDLLLNREATTISNIFPLSSATVKLLLASFPRRKSSSNTAIAIIISNR